MCYLQGQVKIASVTGYGILFVSKITQILGAGKNSRCCEILELEQHSGCLEMKFWVLKGFLGRALEILGAGKILGSGKILGAEKILGAGNILAAGCQCQN